MNGMNQTLTDGQQEPFSEKLELCREAVSALKAALSKMKVIEEKAQNYEILQQWLQDSSVVADVFPFSELYRTVLHVVSSLSLVTSNFFDLIAFCEDYGKEGGALALMFHDWQEIRQAVESMRPGQSNSSAHGKYLAKWLNYHACLAKKAPFSFIFHGVLTAFVNKTMTTSEYERLHKKLIETEAEIAKTLKNLSYMLVNPCYSIIDDVCTKEKHVRFLGANICLAGEMRTSTMKKWQHKLLEMGANPCDSITKEVDYLVIGANSSPCWEFSPYSWKVKSALRQKDAGSQMEIIRESSLLYMHEQIDLDEKEKACNRRQ